MTANARRGGLQTLLVDALRGEPMGLLPKHDLHYGKHSLKLGIPGLNYGRPLAFKAGSESGCEAVK